MREALRAGVVVELFATPEALQRHPEFADSAVGAGARVIPVTREALQRLTDTVTPQGVVAVCQYLDVSLSQALTATPTLVAVLAEIGDPGNAGTVLRSADAAGAGAVWFTDRSVDPYNGKCVRASAGSLFHLPVIRGGDPRVDLPQLQATGLTVLAADARGEADLDDLADAGTLAAPTAWLFGSEAHGLSAELGDAADVRVRVPIHGQAESLNLAAAAAVCLYASARAQRVTSSRPEDT